MKSTSPSAHGVLLNAAQLLVTAFLLLGVAVVRANIPGGGTGTGANVTLTDSGTVVTLSNGIVSIPITKSGATINAINYTHDNGSGAVTTKMLSGGYNGGLFYWEFGGFGDGGTYTYSLVADPLHPTGSNAVGDYAEIAITRGGAATGTVEIHFSMRRGSPGFYVTPIWSHGSADGAQGLGETRTNIYAGSIFNWMSVDAARNRQMEVGSGATTTTAYGAPVESYLWTNGVYQGQYEDKYKYSADLGVQRVWGWSSVTTTTPAFTGSNVGLWDVLASAECYGGGPLKRDLMSHIGTTILNMFNSGHYGGGIDTAFSAGEVWKKAYGPYFVYCNSVAGSPADPAGTLYSDAQAQAAAEASAWPYTFFSNASYAPASGRGTVTGKLVINDSGNPNASASAAWVGVVQQPATSGGYYDFQKWTKPYQFWVKTDAGGNFSIPNVIAGTNYTLYAFGPGAPGTFESQALTGGNMPLTTAFPATPFAVTVTGGITTALGSVVWTPARVGPTVFEIGAPDRYSSEFRHGDDYWVSDMAPDASSPSPNWAKYLDYPVDFPTGVSYTVGTSRWTTDWNFVQPPVLDSTGKYNPSTSTISFNLASAPGTGTQASLYLALASDYQGPIVVTVNGTNLGSVTTTATPSSVSSTGYFPSYSGSGDQSDTNIREGPHGSYSDERITFASSLLKQGANTLTIQMRKADYFADHAMYDYVRLELAGYTPPAPAGVTAYAGNSRTLLAWPVTPGATSYNVLRSTTSGSGYTTVATGVAGPVSGSGPANATYVDTTAANGTAYYYVVQSVNPTGASASSAQSAAVTPIASATTAPPSAVAGLSATAASGAVTLGWTAAGGANYYTVKRSTLVSNGSNGTYATLSTITLTNSVTGSSYTDSSISNGTIYAYTVSATNAVGTSGDSAAAGAIPRAAAPTAAPATVTATALQNSNAGSIQLNWSAVAGATGYLVQSATSANGPYTSEASLSPLTYTDSGLSPNTTYYYQVAAVDTGGASSFATASATVPPAAPASLSATTASSRVTLNWTTSAGATSYVIGRATVSGGPYTTVASAATGTTFVDRTVLNGVAYYYVIAATGAGGTGNVSAETGATPVGAPAVVWTGGSSTVWDTATTNWNNSGGTAATYANGNAVVFDDTATGYSVATSGTLTPDSVLFNDATAYTLNASGLSGAAGLFKTGAGTLTITGASTFTGGTTISAGAVAINGGTSNAQNGLGSGTISLQGGTLTLNGYTGSNSSSYGVLANPIDVPAGSTGLMQVTQRGGQSGAVTGAGMLTLQINYLRGDISGDWSAFTGQVNVVRTRTGTNVDNFRLNANTGFGTAAINLGPYVQASTPLNASNSFTFGELSSTDSTAQLSGIIYNSNTPGSYTATYVVGGRNTSATFAGSIINGSSPSLTAITKAGSGTWTLSGANTYTGATAVTRGTLNVTGTISGTTSLAVAAGSILAIKGGSVSVNGPVTNNGTMRLTGAAGLSTTGTFTNNGILDLINGPQTFPAGFVNNGTVLTGSTVAVSSVTRTVNGTSTIVFPGYAGHVYQLQSTPSLTTPSWQNVGNSQTVPGTQIGVTPVTLTDSSATGSAMFYHVVITPAP